MTTTPKNIFSLPAYNNKCTKTKASYIAFPESKNCSKTSVAACFNNYKVAKLRLLACGANMLYAVAGVFKN